MNTGRPKSSCPSAEDLSAYVDGELAGEARSAVARHLKTCSRCRKQVEELEHTSVGLRRLFDSAAVEIDASANRAGRSTGVRVLRWWLRAGVAAAAVVLAVVTVLLVASKEGTRGPAPAPRGQVEARSPEEPGAWTVYGPPSLRADTVALASAGDVDAQIVLCRLGLGRALGDGHKEPLLGGPFPTLEEQEAVRQRFSGLTERVLGGERWDDHSDDDSSGQRASSCWFCWRAWPVPGRMVSKASRNACWATA